MRRAIVTKDSVLLRLAVELYVRHRPDGVDRCAACARFACPTRRHAGEVIRAAGTDPVLLDRPPRRPEAMPWASGPTTELPVYGAGSAP